MLSTDWYHRRGIEDYDLPGSFDDEVFLADITTLERGDELEISFREHRSEGTRRLKWDEALIVEGLYALSHPRLLRRSSLRVYMSTSEYLAGARRALRDVLLYGDSMQVALDRLETKVLPALNRDVRPQKSKADLEYSGPDDWAELRSRLERLR